MLAATILSVPLFAAGFKAASFPHETAGARATPVRTTAASPNPRPSAPAVRYHGRTAREWAGRYRARTWQLQNARAVLRHRSSVTEAINLACAIYGNCSTLWRKARCESGLNPNAKNGSEASGLFQFLPSTWATTPFGSFSIFSPYASALAAGWMHARGRGGEWVCR